MAKLLLQNGAEVDAADVFNDTALHMAAEEGRIGVVSVRFQLRLFF